jgi:hypothetical protein
MKTWLAKGILNKRKDVPEKEPRELQEGGSHD